MINMIRHWLGLDRKQSLSPAIVNAQRSDERNQADLHEIRTRIALITGNRESITGPIPKLRREDDRHEFR
jgi:hypothetical protein